MDRAQVEQLVKKVYAARVRGDADGIVAGFAEDAVFRLSGSPQASAVAARADGAEGVRKQMAQFIQAFEFQRHEILAILVDGARAAVHSRITVRATATGQSAVTELCDLLEFKDGRIASFTQFADTALAAKLLSA